MLLYVRAAGRATHEVTEEPPAEAASCDSEVFTAKRRGAAAPKGFPESYRQQRLPVPQRVVFTALAVCHHRIGSHGVPHRSCLDNPPESIGPSARRAGLPDGPPRSAEPSIGSG